MCVSACVAHLLSCWVNYNVLRLDVSTVRRCQSSEQIYICVLWPGCRASLPLNCWLRAALCVHTCASAWVSACMRGSLCACCLRLVHLVPGSFCITAQCHMQILPLRKCWNALICCQKRSSRSLLKRYPQPLGTFMLSPEHPALKKSGFKVNFQNGYMTSTVSEPWFWSRNASCSPLINWVH